MQAQIIVASIFLLVSIFAHRPLQYTSSIVVFHSVLYFMSAYLIGIICSQKKEFIYQKLKNKEFILLIIAIALSFLQAFIGKKGNYTKALFVYDGVDLMFIKELVMALFFMVWLNRFETKKMVLLDKIAATSFGIFFIHCLLIIVVIKIKAYYHFSFPSNNPLIYITVIVSIMTLSFLIVTLIKKSIPKYSRYLIGS